MRFSRPAQALTNPLVMRFGGETVPAMPIGVPTIWAGIGFRYEKKPTVQTATLIEWLNPRPLARETSAWWKTEWFSLVYAQFETHWLFSPLVSTKISFGFELKTPLHERHTKVAWIFSPEQRAATSVNWLAKTQLYDLQTSIVWRGNTELHAKNFSGLWLKSAMRVTQFTGHYNDIDATRHPHYLHYGPTPSRWLCSGKYRPQKGRVRMRLSSPKAAIEGVVVMRFTASPVVCVYLPGGGYKANVPKTPVIDSNLPIEPQVQRAYVMQPTIDCIRVRDNQRIVINAASFSHSRGQFAHTISCEFSSRIDSERTKNELLKWTVNGYEFYGYIEQYSKRTIFGDENYSGTGRSRVAEIAAPYKSQISYTNMVVRSFAGILQDLMQFTDWTVELLGVLDFNVPARAFSTAGLPPIESINEAVGELGCMVICDDVNQRIKVIPRWPVSPWLTATAVPDIVVHDAVIQEQNESDQISPLFDCVFVRGEQVGVSAKVRRQGTAGTAPAADISSALIVDVQAARMAGTAAIADSGKKRNWQLTLPVMAALPPFRIGQLIGVRVGTDVFKATCESMSMRCSVDTDGAIEVSQSVSLIESLE